MRHFKSGVAALWMVAGAAWAGSYEDGLRLKQAQQLAPAAAAFEAALTKEPNHVAALEQLAIVQGWLGRHEASVASWGRLIALQPDRADHRVGLARVLYWQGQRGVALAELDLALSLDPDHLEARTLLGDVLLADGQRGPAKEAYTRSLGLPGADTAALTAKLEAATPPPTRRLDAGAIFDDYDNARGSENSQYLQIGQQALEGLTIYGRYERFSQFGARDQGLTVGSYWLPHRRWLLQGELGATVDRADFRSDLQALLNAEWLLAGPVQPLLGLRLLRYDDGEVATVTPGVRVLAGAAVAELRYGLTRNLDDERTGVFSARLGYDIGRASPYLIYTQGEEALPPQALAKVRVLGAGCVWTLDRHWSLRADYSHEDREDIYRHHALGLGFSYRY